jgi:cytochrome P450
MALSWLWYLLSKNPAVERKVREEILGTIGERPPTLGDLPRLGYARMVVDETLRLYPSTWLLSHKAVEDDTIEWPWRRIPIRLRIRAATKDELEGTR